jgi:FkbM family methyltransferase
MSVLRVRKHLARTLHGKIRLALFVIFEFVHLRLGRLLGFGYIPTIPREVDIVSHFIAPRVIVDIGGNIGSYSQYCREKFPQAEIHIFEPSRTNCLILRKSFFTDRLVKIAPFACSNFSGTVNLWRDSVGSGLASLSKRNVEHFGLSFDTSEEVQVIRFYDYFERFLNKEIDLVKIDVEGHELQVLQGFGSSINSMKFIQFEMGGDGY